MSTRYQIINGLIINEGEIFEGDISIKDGIIAKVTKGSHSDAEKGSSVIDAEGSWVLPGIIDDQVHFREPGLTHKGDIYSESKAAVAGGITSYMEMPNTFPPVLTQDLLAQKYQIANERSLANYSFYMGASNSNIDEILRTDPRSVCGVKVFMGASTGDMLVDDPDALHALFSRCRLLIAVHCEDEETIRNNLRSFQEQYGEDAPPEVHSRIRSEEACFKSSSLAVELAKMYHTRLHVLHLSTGREMQLFDPALPLSDKMITAEVCVHHLWFDEDDYKRLGTRIKWNPAIKTRSDRDLLMNALLGDRIDVVATDHAPHTIEEKNKGYFKAPSGGPLVQHSLVAMLELAHQGKITPTRIVTKMCHNPAILFQIEKRGFIREGYWADITIVNPNDPWTVEPSNILYKCGWSPFEGYTFNSKITHTFVNGNLVYDNGAFNESQKGQRLLFNR
jgi:dihydroorotase